MLTWLFFIIAMTWLVPSTDLSEFPIQRVELSPQALLFFCWRLLGYVPGGAPFSQLNKGVKDAMALSTK